MKPIKTKHVKLQSSSKFHNKTFSSNIDIINYSNLASIKNCSVLAVKLESHDNFFAIKMLLIAEWNSRHKLFPILIVEQFVQGKFGSLNERVGANLNLL